MIAHSKILSFGKVQFRVAVQEPRLLETIEAFFSLASLHDGKDLEDGVLVLSLEDLEGWHEASAECTSDSDRCFVAIRLLITSLYAMHDSCIWIDAACLLSPEDKLILVCGPSCSGKTTLSLAMAHALGWRIIAEDITLVELGSKLVLPCPSPSGIRPGTLERIKKLCALPQGMDFPQAFYFNKRPFASTPVEANFDLVLLLEDWEKTKVRGDFDLTLQPLACTDLLRRLLSISNLLRFDKELAPFAELVKNARIFQLSGGELDQRVRLLTQLSASEPTNRRTS